MRIVYVGHSSAPVEITGTQIIAHPGEPVEVPADIARGLLKQTDAWQRPARPKPKKEEE